MKHDIRSLLILITDELERLDKNSEETTEKIRQLETELAKNKEAIKMLVQGMELQATLNDLRKRNSNPTTRYEIVQYPLPLDI